MMFAQSCQKEAKFRKSCSKLLVMKKVALKPKSGSKVAEHNLAVPTPTDTEKVAGGGATPPHPPYSYAPAFLVTKGRLEADLQLLHNTNLPGSNKNKQCLISSLLRVFGLFTRE